MTTTGILPTYQRFINGVPVPFSRRSFRAREKYVIFSVFITFGLICFGTFFFLPEFRGNSGPAESMYKMYDQIKRAGPELLIPPPPQVQEEAPRLLRHEDDVHADPHVLDDREKLRAKIEEDRELKVLERPGLQRTSSTAKDENVGREELGDGGQEVVTIPPAMSDRYPIIAGGEDGDPVARERRSKVKEVILIIGLSGACRSDELTNLTVDNVIDKDDILIIRIPDTKNNKQRTFTVCNNSEKENSIDVISICRKYFNLRPQNMNSSRLFVKYNNGKCAQQNVGHHTIGAIPSKIATFLNLPNSKEYTGHCLRRTSATLLADSGADILTLKRHGGWKSSSVAEGYVEESISNKISVSKKILNTEHIENDSSLQKVPHVTVNVPNVSNQNASVSTFSENTEFSALAKQGICFPNCTINNPVFNINILN